MNESTSVNAVPTASELNRVSGFDPMKHLRQTVNAYGEPVMRLEHRYQKLWFRLAYPQGRMLLNPLRITGQMAIFEAKVFFHREDPTPASSFTSNKTAHETPNYIRAAQDEALKEALDNAGFGIQFCDDIQTPGSSGPAQSSPPAQMRATGAATETESPAVTQKDDPPIQEMAGAPKAAAEPVSADVTTEAPVTAQAPEQITPVVEAPAAPLPVEKTVAASEPVHEVHEAAGSGAEPKTGTQNAPQQGGSQQIADSDDTRQSLLKVLDFPAPAEDINAASETASSALEEAETPAQAAPSYTEDMTVEEILQRMTMEEAQAVIVPRGPCMGWTMAQVAKQRPSSLRFFLTKFCECSNAQKAAATLLLQDMEQNKTG